MIRKLQPLPEGVKGVRSDSVATTRTITVPDTDYLSIGYWFYVPEDAASANDYAVGVFADGAPTRLLRITS